jgi:gas vesicle protein
VNYTTHSQNTVTFSQPVYPTFVVLNEYKSKLKNKIMSTVKVVLGVVAGAATGALLGVLFAPARGAVTRRSICRKGERQVDELKHSFNEFIDSITDKFDKVKEEVVDFAEEAMKSTETVEKDVKAAKVK